MAEDPVEELQRRPADPRPIIAALHAHAVDYLIAGGVAVNAYGYGRYTQDLDIIPSPDAPNMERLAEALAEIEAVGADFGGKQHPLDFSRPEGMAVGNYFLDTKFGALDLLNGERPDLKRYRVLEAAATAIELSGTPVKVIGKDDLIAMKREAGRPKDLRDIAALTEVERNP